jgi:hypothetical protein
LRDRAGWSELTGKAIRISAVNIAWILLLLGGCASAPYRQLDDTSASIEAFVRQSTPVSITDAFFGKHAIALSTLKSDLAVSPSRTPLIEFAGYRSLAVPVVNDARSATSVTIESYVIRTSDGRPFMFYPILSVVADDGSVVETLKPKYEFDFDGKVLTNTFAVAANARRFLVHSSPEYFGYSFSQLSTSGVKPGSFAGAAGVVGAVAASALELALRERTEERDVKLGPAGVISIRHE